MNALLPEGSKRVHSPSMRNVNRSSAALLGAALIFGSAAALVAAPIFGARPALAQDREEKGEDGLTDPQREVVKPIKQLITSIRYSKDDLANGFLAHRRMCEIVCGDAWKKFTPEQQKEFADGYAYLLKRISFPKARELFEHLDSLLHEVQKIEGDKAHVKQVVVIFRNYKKEEIILEYAMERSADGKWQVVDVVAEGESTLEGIREDQVEPLLKEGGNDLLLKKMREKVAEVKAKEPKDKEGDKK